MKSLPIIATLLGFGMLLSISAGPRTVANSLIQARTQTPLSPVIIRPSRTLEFASMVRDVKWSPDGSRVACVSGPSLSIWDTKTWQSIYITSDADATSVTWSPDSNLVATTKGGTQEYLDIWDGKTGELLNEFKRPPYGDGAYAWISQSAWSPDGKFIATNASNGGILIWSATTGEVSLIGPSMYQNTVQISWSPDSKRLASSVAVWDAIKDRKILDIQAGNWLSWNPSQEELATSGIDPSTVQILDTNSGDLLYKLSGHTGNILAVAWSSDGKFLASAATDATVLIWDPLTKTPIASLEGHTNAINSVAWNPLARIVASGGSDNTVRIWDLGTVLPATK